MSSYANIHILVPEPTVEFHGDGYPSVAFGDGAKVKAIISPTGDPMVFADRLRAVAMQIEDWARPGDRIEPPDPIDEAKAEADRIETYRKDLIDTWSGELVR